MPITNFKMIGLIGNRITTKAFQSVFSFGEIKNKSSMIRTLKKKSVVLVQGDTFIQTSRWVRGPFMSSSVNTADAKEKIIRRKFPSTCLGSTDLEPAVNHYIWGEPHAADINIHKLSNMHEISSKDAIVQMKQTTKLPRSTLDALMTLFYPSVLSYVLHNTFYSQFKIRN